MAIRERRGRSSGPGAANAATAPATKARPRSPSRGARSSASGGAPQATEQRVATAEQIAKALQH
eukprot:11243653-Alexandrium_andersonii.AAC.1